MTSIASRGPTSPAAAALWLRLWFLFVWGHALLVADVALAWALAHGADPALAFPLAGVNANLALVAALLLRWRPSPPGGRPPPPRGRQGPLGPSSNYPPDEPGFLDP